MLALLISTALAACPQTYGQKQANGSWNFYLTQKPGSLPVEVDPETCYGTPEALNLSADGKSYVLDQAVAAQVKAAERSEVQSRQARRDRLKVLKTKTDLTDAEVKEVLMLLLRERAE